MSKASGSIDLKALKVAGEGASKYITEISGDDGIDIHTEEGTRHVHIDDDSVDIMDGQIVLASFGETMIVGDVNGYHTTITETDFDISNGLDSMFNVNATGATKNITATLFDLPPTVEPASGASRERSFILKASVTYTFYMYRSSSAITYRTYNSDDDGDTMIAWEDTGNRIKVTFLVVGDGTVRCRWQQSDVEPMYRLYRAYATYPATIDVPAMTFQGSVTIESHDSPIGTIVTGSASPSVSSGTTLNNLTGCYVDLTTGVWLVSYACSCDVGVSGKTLAARLAQYNDSTLITGYTSSRQIIQSSSTLALSATGCIPIEVTNDTDRIYVQAYQNSGSSKTINGYLRAVRIS